MGQRGTGRIRPVGVRADDVAVTDVLGSLLLVGLTVLMAAGLGLLLLNFDGPADTLHVDVELRTTPGDDGVWDTGDERVELMHLGGEPLHKDDTELTFAADGTDYRYTGDALGSFFDDDGDGRLTIGEAWLSPAADAIEVAQDEAVDAALVTRQDTSQLVAAGTVTGGGIELTATSCLPDLTAPAGSFSQAPPNANVNSLSSGAVVVTLTVSDACTGVDEAATPTFHYCVAVTCTVPSSFTTLTVADAGTRTWTATIPSRIWLTEAIAGKSIQYYAGNMRDLAGNVGQTGVQTDVIDLVVTYYYVEGANAATGTVTALANAQAGSAFDGNLADLREAGVTGSAATVGPTKFGGVTVTNSGVLNANNVLASDDARAEFDSSGDLLEVTGFDLPANAASVSAVTIGVEARKASNGGSNPALRLDYKLGVSGTYNNGAAQPISNTGNDNDYTRSLSGITTVAQLESLHVRVVYQTDENRNPQVDRVFATVTYMTTAQTEYRLDIELEWASASSGTSNTLELRYRAQDDTFTVEVQNQLTLVWRTCSGTLASTSLATYTCTLQANEILLGEARIRIRDVAMAGTTQAHLFLDHARLAVA